MTSIDLWHYKKPLSTLYKSIPIVGIPGDHDNEGDTDNAQLRSRDEAIWNKIHRTIVALSSSGPSRAITVETLGLGPHESDLIWHLRQCGYTVRDMGETLVIHHS